MIDNGIHIQEEDDNKGITIIADDPWYGMTFQNYDEVLKWCQDLLDRSKAYFKV